MFVGPLVGLFGTKWFPYVMGGLGAVVSFFGLLALMNVFGFMETTTGFYVCLGVAALLGILTGWLLYKMTWVSIGFIGIFGGFFLGSLIYAIVRDATGWEFMMQLWP